MRQIGTLPPTLDPKRLTDHLLTLGVTTKVDSRPEGAAVWVHHEDQIPLAKQELEQFLKDPHDARYHVAAQSAESIRREADRLDRQYRKNVRDLSGQLNRPTLKRRPLTTALIAISVVVYLLQNGPYGWATVNFLAFSVQVVDELGIRHSLGLSPILQGEVWRLITPIFIHFNILHILFNMWWLWTLGTLVEVRRGTASLAAVVFVSAIASNLGEFFYDVRIGHELALFGGMSGVVYAVFGYVWMRGRQEPELGMTLDYRTVQMMLFWLVLCFSGAVGNVANAAHLVGLVAGMFLGLARI
ncbi:GlpG protein [Singulisphaera sp. GP187]|uniref:rhomboid family intramembrane serine protease n=1 Tax=Singulisphaera sp. GP187 TaxID=1882752 RepID=UPI00092B2BB5|nr:rhomboid family intramembrane serine protease [Singulisphaera sp. GP187]SIN96487.1 GlpG protein [Singulisphaera sp. GP187]